MEMDKRVSAAHGGHRDRLRQRVAAEGLEGLAPHEMIEFLLCYTIPRQDVNDLAHALIGRFGNVRDVLKAVPEDLEQVKGMGRRSAYFLALLGELVMACGRLQPQDRQVLRNYLDVFRFALSLRLRTRPCCCVQICLDASGGLMYCREICPSLSWGESEVMRQAISDVLALQARNVILIENVGTRLVQPEPYDIRHAEGYGYALHAAGSALLDVVLVGELELYSMRQTGLIQDYKISRPQRALREDYLRGMPERGRMRLEDVEAGPQNMVFQGGCYESIDRT